MKKYSECPEVDMTDYYRSEIIDGIEDKFSNVINHEKVNPRSIFNLIEDLEIDIDTTDTYQID